MSQKTPRAAPNPGPNRPPLPTDSLRPPSPVEPAEVLGRHKNTGQKDHKGAR
jgi:hypothetical protein